MEMPLVTVVTVTYNSSKYIRDAIESVLAQTYTNIEYIIGDDCSNDNTWAIIEEYNDPRIKAYRNPENYREYPNRNKAIDLAKGEYLIFIDGDDIIYHHGIYFFVNMMQAFPLAGMAIQKNYFNNILFPAFMAPSATLQNYIYNKTKLLSSSFTSNFFKTTLLKQFKLKTNFISGDEEIRLRIAANHPVLFVSGWVSWPRETPNQVSSRISMDKRMIEIFQYTNEILLNLKSEHFDVELLNDMSNVVKKWVAKFAIRLLTEGKFITLKRFLYGTKISWSEIFKYLNYVPLFDDELKSHSPENPFRSGF